jgi:hypothetical protein
MALWSEGSGQDAGMTSEAIIWWLWLCLELKEDGNSGMNDWGSEPPQRRWSTGGFAVWLLWSCFLKRLFLVHLVGPEYLGDDPLPFWGCFNKPWLPPLSPTTLKFYVGDHDCPDQGQVSPPPAHRWRQVTLGLHKPQKWQWKSQKWLWGFHIHCPSEVNSNNNKKETNNKVKKRRKIK